MTYAEHIQQVRAAAEGDAYVGLLTSKLDGGHVVQAVFVRGDAVSGYKYVFQLARLGALTDVTVPTGGEVDRLLRRRGLRMATEEDEAKRLSARLYSVLKPTLEVVGKNRAKPILQSLADRVGIQRGRATVSYKSFYEVPKGSEFDVILLWLESTFDEDLTSLADDLGYSWDAATELGSKALLDLIDVS